MNHNEILLAISYIRPNAEFSLSGNELEWLDKNQKKPTKTEIDAGWIAYQTTQKTEAESKAAQRQLILDKLGLTADEARLLLG